MRRVLILFFLAGILGSCKEKENTEVKTGQLQRFPLSAVRLLQSPFLDAQKTDMDYILALKPDRLLAPYVADAGLEPKAKRYGNWEDTGLDGHIGGHYLTALAQMYAATGNKELQDRLTHMIDVLGQCQDKNGNGYVGGIPGGQEMWQEIKNGNINAGSFSLNDKWVPLYNIHKLYAGLRDAYLIAGNEKAKKILIGLTDWMINLTADLTDDQIQDMLRSEHGGLNEVFADVAAITGDDKYLTLAERFSQKKILDPLIDHRDELTGMHANTQIPKVIGYERVAELSHKQDWSGAAEFFWDDVVNQRTVSIGGNSVREHFHPVNDFSSMIESNQGPETCNTYNMLRLSELLFLQHPDAKYMDYYERAIYNHILSSQHPDGGLVYFTPMRPRHYRVYSQSQKCFWCCVGSGIENHGKYGEMIYAHDDNDLYVNLFIPSQLDWSAKGRQIIQETAFPYAEKSSIEIKTKSPDQFSVFIRYPKWVEAGKLKISVNDEEQKYYTMPSSYVEINREWHDGDKIHISLPMHTYTELLPDSSDWVSFLHGPIVLAAVTDSTDLDGLWADGSRMGHVANGKMYPIDQAPLMLAGDLEHLASKIQPVDDGNLEFSASDLLYPQKYKTLKLVPFYTIHEARYMVYWPIVKENELESKLAGIREREKTMLALEAKTIDKVAPGEQQPETEHNFKGKDTDTGLNQQYFWRDASGWFSYELKNPNGEARLLQVRYFSGDNGRTFDILLNDNLLTTVHLEDHAEDLFYDVTYEIPENQRGNKILKVTFKAHEDSRAGGIYEVRLLK